MLHQFLQNMRRLNKFLMIAAATVMAASCSTKAVIDGTVASLQSGEVIVKLLDINKYQVLDTVATDAAGRFSYKVNVEAGQPEFVYVFHKDTKIASLLLEAGDNVTVTADTLGNYTVAGSEESLKLAQVEKNFAASLLKLNDLAVKLETASDKEMSEISRAMGQEYVRYYRESVKYIMQNSSSLTSVPVLFQYFSPELPVFGQNTDAIHFRSVADSLELVYPESKYLQALRKEAQQRYNYLELQAKIDNAQEVSYVDIELPDVKGQKVKLSEIEKKVTLVYFWTATDASQKMFNLDVLKPLYEDFHKRGFEIFHVAMDVDKALWAKTVKDQELPWVNVCDSRGAESPYVTLYNIAAIPSMLIIKDGELVDGRPLDQKSLHKLIDQLLR